MKSFKTDQIKTFRTPKYTGISLSLLSMFVLMAMIVVWNRVSVPQEKKNLVRVLAEEKLNSPLLEIAKEFKKEFNINVDFEFFGSDASINLDDNLSFHLYISTAMEPESLNECNQNTLNVIPITKISLVVASKQKSGIEIENFYDFIDQNLTIGLCDKNEWAGMEFHKILESNTTLSSRLKQRIFKKKSELFEYFEKNEALDAIITSSHKALDKNFSILPVYEMADKVYSVNCKIINQSNGINDALMFANYIAAKNRGQKFFKKDNYIDTLSDYWNESPSISIFCEKKYKSFVLKDTQNFSLKNKIDTDIQFPDSNELLETIVSISQSKSQNLMPDLLFVSKQTADKLSPNYRQINCKNKQDNLYCFFYFNSKYQGTTARLCNFVFSDN